MDNALKAILIAVLIAVYIVVTFTIIINPMVCKIFNPKNLYRETKLNYFGTAIVAIFLNITFLPYAIIYWFLVLCHAGRK